MDLSDEQGVTIRQVFDELFPPANATSPEERVVRYGEICEAFMAWFIIGF